MIKKSLLIFLLIISKSTMSSEIDEYTNRKNIMEDKNNDATYVINKLINGRIRAALTNLNQLKHDCDRQKLESWLLRYLGDKKIRNFSMPIGPLEWEIDYQGKSKYALDEYGRYIPIPRNKVRKRYSIYRKLRFLEAKGISMHMGTTIKVCKKHLIGSDKLTHFMAQGHSEHMFANEEEALNWAIESEYGRYGYDGTGVFSYGDLAANYSGKLYWDNLLEGKKSQFVCKNGKYYQSRKFNVCQHVNPAWSEAINPSKFRPDNPYFPNQSSLQEKVNVQLQYLQRKGDIDSYPVANKKMCKEIRNYYPQRVLKFIVSPRCLELL